MVWRTIFGVRLTNPLGSSYIVIVDDKEEAFLKGSLETEKKREIDLNRLFPRKEYDLNRLFPDEETKRLLYELRRNKRDIERFIMSLDLEEE